MKGLFLPDGIGAYTVADQTFLVTANEGDTRNYTDFGGTYNEESRIGSLKLDPTAFPTGNDLKNNAKLGRLKVTNTKGFYIDNLGQKVFTELFSFGARSFSIRTSDGRLVWDSGDQFEQITKALKPEAFNASNDNNSKDAATTKVRSRRA